MHGLTTTASEVTALWLDRDVCIIITTTTTTATATATTTTTTTTTTARECVMHSVESSVCLFVLFVL